MLDVALVSEEMADYSATDRRTSIAEARPPDATHASVIARSRRPAILTYASPMVDAAKTLSGLLWYMLGWKKESERLVVSVFEGVEFGKGRKNIPQGARVVVEADEKMQFYELRINVVAKLGGLRYVLGPRSYLPPVMPSSENLRLNETLLI